jgi:DNA-binding MarR family transcriptional regulator
MIKTQAGVEHQVLPLLEYLARVGHRAHEIARAPGGLRPRHLIVLKLLSERGPASQQALADALSLDPSNVVGLLNELEERGMITRRRDPVDRRRHIVEPSPTGEDELALAYARISLVEDQLLRNLSDEERGTLYRLLIRAAGVESLSCDPAGEPQPSPESTR